MTLGENLQSLRKKAGLSQEEVAGRLFVSRQSVSKWENDQAEPGVENLKALAGVYGVTMDELTGVTPFLGVAGTGPAAPEAVSADSQEREEVSFYQSVFAARTVTAVVLEMLLIQGGVKIPFDWLAMLVGLFVRKAPVWGVTQVFLWLNVAINLWNLVQNPVIGAIGLVHAGAFLYTFFRREIRDYFHVDGSEIE